MSYTVKMTDQAYIDALARHEENFQKELEQVDIREVVLKTKKSVLEQARQNSSTYNAVLDHDADIKNLKSNLRTLQATVSLLSTEIQVLNEKLDNNSQIFANSIRLLEQLKSEVKEEQKSPIKRFWEFIKCLVK
jgi:chromosome segregation ATPase